MKNGKVIIGKWKETIWRGKIDMDVQRFEKLYMWFEFIGQNDNNTFMPIHPNKISEIKYNLQNLAEEVKQEYPYFYKELMQLKERLFY